MNWIAVHDNVTGGKLRGLRKKLSCSEAEALGILILLWLWARKNADAEGMIPNTDLEDVEVIFTSTLPDELSPKKVVEALHEDGWIETEGDTLYIHDWSEWQRYSYSHEVQKVKDRERQRKFREKKRAAVEAPKVGCHGDSNGDSNGDTPPKPPKPPKKKVEEPKIKYSDFVSMTEVQYQKLVESYSEPFAKKCVEVLDNYKGSSGKKYKDDYRAILNWVVDRVKEKHPELVRRETTSFSGNPFRQAR